MELELLRFINLAWIIIHLSLLIPFYMERNRLSDKTQSLKLIGIIIGLGVIGFIAIQFHALLRPVELGIILGFPALAMVIYMIPRFLVILGEVRIQHIQLRDSVTHNILLDSMQVISKNVETTGDLQISTSVRPNRWYEFEFSIFKDPDNKSRLFRRLVPSGATFTNYRILLFTAYYAIIIPVVESSFQLSFPFINITIDAELTFFALMVLIVTYLNYLRSTQKQFHDEFAELIELSKIDLVKKIAKRKVSTEENENVEIEHNKSTLELAKEKALSIKDIRFREEINRKQEEMRAQINSILNDDEGEKKHFDSEIYNKQVMIRKIQRILNSTPVGKEILLQAIMDKVDIKEEDVAESIIIGLISNNKVKGKYDIWEKRYLVGNAGSRFIEQTLESLRISPSDFEYVKISKSGDMEIRFSSNGKTINKRLIDSESDTN